MSNIEKLKKIDELVQHELKYIAREEKRMLPYDEWKHLQYQKEYLTRLKAIIKEPSLCEQALV